MEGVGLGEFGSSRRVKRPRRGFTLLEAVLVVVVLGLLRGIATPYLIEAHARAQLSAARTAFTASHGLARQVAEQYGRISKLHIDPIENSFWVTVDTTALPWGGTGEDTVEEVVHVGEVFAGVRIEANRGLLCYDPRGLGTAIEECELPNATIVLQSRSYTDSLTISRAGRLLHRR